MKSPALGHMHLPADVDELLALNLVDWHAPENGVRAKTTVRQVGQGEEGQKTQGQQATATGQGTAQTPKRRRHQGKASIKRHRQNKQRQRRAKKRQAREAAHEVH